MYVVAVTPMGFCHLYSPGVGQRRAVWIAKPVRCNSNHIHTRLLLGSTAAVVYAVVQIVLGIVAVHRGWAKQGCRDCNTSYV